jgi:hypothetical protein
MPLTPISLGVRSNPGRYGQDSATRLVNCYSEDAGEEGRIQFPVYAADGYSTFGSTATNDGVRAMIAISSTAAYAVVGRGVYKIDNDGVVTSLGGIDSDGLTFMARNRASPAQVVLTCGGLVYSIESDVLTQISDIDLPAPNSVTNLDGYFVFTIEDGRFFLSGIDDVTIDSGDFSVAEASPDGLLVCKRRGRELVLFGPQSMEFHINTGNADFPFERQQAVDIGCYAAGSATEVTFIRGESTTDTIIWAATDQQGAYAGVMMLNGYTGVKISTHAVDRAIRDEGSDTDNILGFTWSAGGHTFYAVVGNTFSWVYDTVTGQWHERESYGLDRWRVATCVTFAGKNILGDYASGNFYEMDHETYTEAGEPLVMKVIPPTVHAWPRPIRISALHVDTIPGVGINSSNDGDANPKIMLDQSNDNGKTWSQIPQRTATIGAIGQYKTRAKFNRLGQTKEDGRTFRISCAAAVAKAITGLAIDFVPLKA